MRKNLCQIITVFCTVLSTAQFAFADQSWNDSVFQDFSFTQALKDEKQALGQSRLPSNSLSSEIIQVEALLEDEYQDFIVPPPTGRYPKVFSETENPQYFYDEDSEKEPEGTKYESYQYLPQYQIGTSSARNNLNADEWQIMPEGLLFPSYLAGVKEPRFASQWLWEKDRGRIWEAAVGGRWGLFRHGTDGPDAEGFQFDVIGAAFVRIDPEEESDVEAADFNAGFMGTWRYGRWRYKLGYNHYSCHLGDEYLIKNPTVTRYNYVRDSIVAGLMFDVTPELQLYGEIANALGTGGGAEPWEFQFGAQYSPACGTGLRGAPFAAVNGHVREEFNYAGSVSAQAGWAWRSDRTNRLFRIGAQHYSGQAMQWSFVGQKENLTGIGAWFDY